MDLLEYMGKEVFARYGIPVASGRVCTTVDEVVAAAETIGGTVVVKAQVQVGGRGKAGGVKLASDAAQARVVGEAILGMDIKGHTVERVLVDPATDIAKEYYASFTLDRRNGKALAMVSAQGGVDIEAVAESDPSAIQSMHIDPLVGFKPFHARYLVSKLDPGAREQAAEILTKLYQCFMDADLSLAEINPLVLTSDGTVMALDAKVSTDDNANFRHAEYAPYRDILTTDPQEKLAKEKGVAYVKLDGFVGIIANGAGLVMSTLDMVKLAGGAAANFLDAGGGSSQEQISAALEIILSDPQVRSVFINIFGGITRCDVVANGILAALERVELKVPMVVRLDGTNAEAGRKILQDAAIPGVEAAPTMWEAAELAVERAAS